MKATKRCLTVVQKRRADAYDMGVSLYQYRGDAGALVRCIHHPDRVVNRSGYVLYRKRLCGSCKTNRRRDGSPRPAKVRNSRARSYAKSLNLRKYFRGTFRGLKLFERLTGFNLENVGFTRVEIQKQNN